MADMTKCNTINKNKSQQCSRSALLCCKSIILFCGFFFFIQFTTYDRCLTLCCVRDVNCCLFIRSYYYIKQKRIRDSHSSYTGCLSTRTRYRAQRCGVRLLSLEYVEISIARGHFRHIHIFDRRISWTWHCDFFRRATYDWHQLCAVCRWVNLMIYGWVMCARTDWHHTTRYVAFACIMCGQCPSALYVWRIFSLDLRAWIANLHELGWVQWFNESK